MSAVRVAVAAGASAVRVAAVEDGAPYLLAEVPGPGTPERVRELLGELLGPEPAEVVTVRAAGSCVPPGAAAWAGVPGVAVPPGVGGIVPRAVEVDAAWAALCGAVPPDTAGTCPTLAPGGPWSAGPWLVVDAGHTGSSATLVRADGSGGTRRCGVGGARLDEAVAALLRAPGGPEVPVAVARQARESLSLLPNVAVRPPSGPPVVLGALEVRAALRPLLAEVAALAGDVAGVRPVPVLLCGGLARTPLLAELLDAAGIGPVYVAQRPDAVAALGALRIPVPAGVGPVPAGPVRGGAGRRARAVPPGGPAAGGAAGAGRLRRAPGVDSGPVPGVSPGTGAGRRGAGSGRPVDAGPPGGPVSGVPSGTGAGRRGAGSGRPVDAGPPGGPVSGVPSGTGAGSAGPVDVWPSGGPVPGVSPGPGGPVDPGPSGPSGLLDGPAPGAGAAPGDRWLPPPPRRRRGAAVAVAAVTVALAAGLLALPWPDRTPDGGGFVVQYGYAVRVPDGWTHAGGMPERRRTLLAPDDAPEGSDVVTVERTALGYDATAEPARALADLRAAFDAAVATGVPLSGFTPDARYAGRPVVTYHQLGPDGPVDWYVLRDVADQLSVGCRHTAAGAAAVARACATVVGSARIG